MDIILRHRTPVLIPDRIRIVGNSNKIKTYPENKDNLLKTHFKKKTTIALKSDIFIALYYLQPSHKILTLSSVLFLSLFFDNLLK